MIPTPSCGRSRWHNNIQAEENVFGDRKVGSQIQFLVNNGDTFCLGFRWVGELDGLSGKFNCSRIRLMNPGNDLHQRTFSCAVLTNHCMDALLLNFEGDVPQRLDTGKTLRNSIYLEDRGHWGRSCRSSGVAGVQEAKPASLVEFLVVWKRMDHHPKTGKPAFHSATPATPDSCLHIYFKNWSTLLESTTSTPVSTTGGMLFLSTRSLSISMLLTPIA